MGFMQGMSGMAMIGMSMTGMGPMMPFPGMMGGVPMMGGMMPPMMDMGDAQLMAMYNRLDQLSAAHMRHARGAMVGAQVGTIAGGLGGALLGFAVGGPVGALLGGMLGSSLGGILGNLLGGGAKAHADYQQALQLV